VTQTNGQCVYQQNGYAFFFHIYLVHIVPTVLKTHLPVFDSMYGSYFLASRVNVHNKSFTHILKFIDVPTIVMLFLLINFALNFIESISINLNVQKLQVSNIHRTTC